MATIKVLAGDYKPVTSFAMSNELHLQTRTDKPEIVKMPYADIDSIEVADETSVKRFAGALGLGALGGIALGGVGAAAGVLAGGNSKEITFIATFKNGSQIMAKADRALFEKLQAARLDAELGIEQQKPNTKPLSLMTWMALLTIVAVTAALLLG